MCRRPLCCDPQKVLCSCPICSRRSSGSNLIFGDMTRRQFIAGLAAAGTALGGKRGDAKQGMENSKVLVIAGFGPIVRDVAASRKLYSGTLAIPFKEEAGGYLHTEALQGAKSFALWPLAHAAEACF